MPLRPCPNVNPCESDTVLGNFSAESPDPPDYLAVFFAGRPSRLLTKWSATECEQTFISTVSQEDADIQAEAAALLCNIEQNNPGGNIFFNQAQSCCIACPDGTPFCYTFPVGIFPGQTMDEANQIAHATACRIAPSHIVCLISNFASSVCQNDHFSGTITAAGPTVASSGNHWLVVAGVLPPGLSLSGTGKTVTISGTPTVSGNYAFDVEIITPSGDHNHKVIALTVDECSLLVLASGLNPSWETNPIFFTAKTSGVPQGASLYELRSVTSITHVGTTATVTIPSHQFSNGQFVFISGASPSGYNTITISPVTGLVIISGVTPNTFNYTLSSDPGIDASGTIICRHYWTGITAVPPPFGFNGLPFGSRSLIAIEDAGGSIPKGTVSNTITQVVTQWPTTLWCRDFATWANTFRGYPVGTFTGQLSLTGFPGRTYRETPAGAFGDYFELVYSGGGATFPVGLDLIYAGGSFIDYDKDPSDPLQPVGAYNYVSGAGGPPATVHVTLL